jgi:hypothetical protein
VVLLDGPQQLALAEQLPLRRLLLRHHLRHITLQLLVVELHQVTLLSQRLYHYLQILHLQHVVLE